MTEQELNYWGTSQGWDVIDRIYHYSGLSKSWMDYSYPDAEDPDEAWDQDAYYADFDQWWEDLPLAEKQKLYNRITK